MEAGKSTTSSCESSDSELNLPCEEFRALPPLVSVDRMMELSEELCRMYPQGIPTEEERAARKVEAEFVLRD